MAALTAGTAMALAGCSHNDAPQTPVALTWAIDSLTAESGSYINSFTIKNISDTPLDGAWEIYYTQMPRNLQQDDNAPVIVEFITGTRYRLRPTDNYAPIEPGDSLVVTFTGQGSVPSRSFIPEGTYFVATAGERKDIPMSIDLVKSPLPMTQRHFDITRRHYDRNSRILAAATPAPAATDIFPSVKHVTLSGSTFTMPDRFTVKADDKFSGEGTLLGQDLAAIGMTEAAEEAPLTIAIKPLADPTKAVNDEYYEIETTPELITIAAATAHGAFNGTRTLLAMIDDTRNLPEAKISDWPDLDYRGMMIDVSRNFTTADNLKKLIDALASYKINVLHLHFIDDEGWRIEIPGLEELTAVGSRRGHTADESDCLYPQYDGNFNPQASTSGNGYYTRQEFIDLLRYADARHIRVIPEVEMPGHARAAIKAMNTRHARYRDSDPIKASEYLLADFDDESKYLSAQWYSDNALNPAMPSTYRFIDKVIGEIAAMYREAGAPLQSIHLGGDEVAHGAWTASPLVKEFMAKNGMTEIRQVAEHFITEASAILEKHGLKFGAWQEAAIGHSPEGDKILAPRAEGIYCWNTVPEWDGDRIPYSIANNGYPVILCNVNNFYLDLAYDPHPAEPGLNWAGYLDETKSLSMLPFDVYRSSRTNIAGNPVNLDNADKGKPALTPEGRANIRGVQAQLWSETVRNFDMVQYYTFPKILGLAERGWNVHPAWETMRGTESDKAFDRDLAMYYAKIGSREMPRWNRSGINFRLPYPGLAIEEGKLLANTPIPGAEIRYTTDGTEPTSSSTLWTAPADCAGKRVKAKLFHLGKESVTAEIE